jgi:hypothetical protein
MANEARFQGNMFIQVKNTVYMRKMTGLKTTSKLIELENMLDQIGNLFLNIGQLA